MADHGTGHGASHARRHHTHHARGLGRRGDWRASCGRLCRRRRGTSGRRRGCAARRRGARWRAAHRLARRRRGATHRRALRRARRRRARCIHTRHGHNNRASSETEQLEACASSSPPPFSALQVRNLPTPHTPHTHSHTHGILVSSSLPFPPTYMRIGMTTTCAACLPEAPAQAPPQLPSHPPLLPPPPHPTARTRPTSSSSSTTSHVLLLLLVLLLVLLLLLLLLLLALVGDKWLPYTERHRPFPPRPIEEFTGTFSGFC